MGWLRMRINFNKPVIVINPNQFKCYCKKRSMKEVFSILQGYGY